MRWARRTAGLVLAVILCSGCVTAGAPVPSPSRTGTGIPAEAGSRPATAAPSSAGAGGSGVSPGDDIPVMNATPALPAVDAPVEVDYEAIGAHLPVVPTEVAEDGQMEIPLDAATAGWYRFSPPPGGSEGATVIAAHNGSPQTPVGAFDDLIDGQAGDHVTVRTETGASFEYQVESVESLGKAGLDLSPYFTRDGPHRLVLITCGGPWDRDAGTYADNVVVIARPVG